MSRDLDRYNSDSQGIFEYERKENDTISRNVSSSPTERNLANRENRGKEEGGGEDFTFGGFRKLLFRMR